MTLPRTEPNSPVPVARLFGVGWIATRWRYLSPVKCGALVAAALAAIVFLPWLGTVGLWDPWEPHYAEVARQMLVRNDYLYPYWESAYFFSKPALSLWMSAMAMKLSGLSTSVEWALRLPVAFLAILTCVLVYLGVSRLASRRAGLLAATALTTMPFYALFARQATTDMPLVALMTCGAICFAVALWDDQAHHRAWAYGGYVFLALATLAKGLLGFGLVAAAILAWFLVTHDWRRFSRLRLVERVGGLWFPVGPLIFLAIAAPWYLTLSLFQGRDDEGHTFAYRFWIHDHFSRLGQGVHATTPGGTFAYFLEQLGFGVFPWVAALPGGLLELGRANPQDRSPRAQLTLFAGLWAVGTFVLMSLSATKFHHYILPAVPAVAILCALFLDRLLEEGLQQNLGALLLGLAALVVVAHGLWTSPKILSDLFVYNYERPFPGPELAEMHRGLGLGPVRLSMAPRSVMAVLFVAGGVALGAACLRGSRRALVGGLVAVAATFAIWISWFHWRDLTPHWSQRDIFQTYRSQRATPDEPILAYYMNWRGETFYSHNLVRQVQDDQRIRELVERPGREWIITERGRFGSLQSALGSQVKLRIADRSNNKLYLVAVEETPPSLPR